ncbi:MAG: hypothetical protein FJ352_00800 [Firmicutes bacterium]|nr:hypothetical protein [Bacillota bacterium]
MAQSPVKNPNANLPPLVVLGSFLTEKKREFVSKKLFEFGLVRKEYFDRKLEHQKKDFTLKKFLGKRYRYTPAPMTDAEVDQIFTLIQTLMSMSVKTNQDSPNKFNFQAVEKPLQKSTALPFSLLGILLVIIGLVGLGGGAYAAYLVYSNAGPLALELAAVIGATSLFFALSLITLARILRIVRALKSSR